MTTHCGYIAICGRPNVGKSTLLNRLLAQKISITSKKPQTTRHRILGIDTEGDVQYVYVDTPGIHASKHPMNRIMNETALNALADVDVILMVVEAGRFTEGDEAVLKAVSKLNVPAILVANKTDRVKEKLTLLPWIQSIEKKYPFKAFVPICAKTGYQLDVLKAAILPYLPEGPHFYEEDQVTDRSVRFLCQEMVREKVFRLCGEEVPYGTSVLIESFKEEENIFRIHALILVENPGQKPIIIGEKGQKLKEISTSARIDMERLLEKKVFLRCFCKVKSSWSTDARILRELGHE